MQPPTPAPIVALDGDTLTLPAEIARRFHPEDRFIILTQGDTLILKRVTPHSLVDLADATPATAPPLDLDEIDDLVHEVRAERTRRSQE